MEFVTAFWQLHVRYLNFRSGPAPEPPRISETTMATRLKAESPFFIVLSGSSWILPEDTVLVG